jgi:hypothetical protein
MHTSALQAPNQLALAEWIHKMVMSRVGHEANKEGSKIVLIPPQDHHPAAIRYLIACEQFIPLGARRNKIKTMIFISLQAKRDFATDDVL